jgi:hypothetical protein
VVLIGIGGELGAESLSKSAFAKESRRGGDVSIGELQADVAQEFERTVKSRRPTAHLRQ